MNGIVPDFVIKQKYPPTKEIKLLHKLYGKERGTKKKALDKEARKLKTGRSLKLTCIKKRSPGPVRMPSHYPPQNSSDSLP